MKICTFPVPARLCTKGQFPPKRCYFTAALRPVQTDWSSFYAPAAEIRAYLEDVVAKYKLMRYIKLSHEVISAHYDEASGKWNLRILQPSGEILDDSADFLFTATGVLSRWKWPDIEGLNQFRGKIIHSAQFSPEDENEWKNNWKDKKVGVIGVVRIAPDGGESGDDSFVAGIQRCADSLQFATSSCKTSQLRTGQDMVRDPVHCGQDR